MKSLGRLSKGEAEREVGSLCRCLEPRVLSFELLRKEGSVQWIKKLPSLQEEPAVLDERWLWISPLKDGRWQGIVTLGA